MIVYKFYTARQPFEVRLRSEATYYLYHRDEKPLRLRTWTMDVSVMRFR